MQNQTDCLIHCTIGAFVYLISNITGYNKSVTGCGSQRRQCRFYSTKNRVNSMISIVKLNLTSLRNIYIKSGIR